MKALPRNEAPHNTKELGKIIARVVIVVTILICIAYLKQRDAPVFDSVSSPTRSTTAVPHIQKLWVNSQNFSKDILTDSSETLEIDPTTHGVSYEDAINGDFINTLPVIWGGGNVNAGNGVTRINIRGIGYTGNVLFIVKHIPK